MFTMTHKSFDAPKDTMYVPLHVGRANAEDLGYLGDHTGENISQFNYCFSELTGIYWVWKNEKEADYVGICHYRRYLINQQGNIFTQQELIDILAEHDLITSKRLQYDYTYYDGYADAHNVNDLIATGEVIKELYQTYYTYFERLVHEKASYFGNIMVASKKTYDSYCDWLFSILLEVQKRIDISSYDDYHKRVFGFLSEFLLLVYVEANQLKAYESMVGMSAEKTETKEMKEQLAVYFQQRDIFGAKDYFMACYQKRPDVLLEASDTTGELTLSMQIIATCENEVLEGVPSLLEQENEFSELMIYVSTINSIVKRYIKNQMLSTDIIYLINQKVSSIALSVAVLLFCENDEMAVKTLLRLIDDYEKQKNSTMALLLLQRCLSYEQENEEIQNRIKQHAF